MRDDKHLHVKVSIITVVFNAVDKIKPTLDSVLEQTHDDVEYIVIDGGSTDGTVDVIGRYRDRISYFVTEPDGGMYDAMNKGASVATGSWVGIMNAGDVFVSSGVLSSVFSSGRSYDGVDVIYGDAVGVDGELKVVHRGANRADQLVQGPVYRHGASFVRREVCQRFPYDLSLVSRLGFALDFEQIFRMYRAGCVFQKVPLMILQYELRGASTVSPFLGTYYIYLITHDMRCSWLCKCWLAWLTLWRGVRLRLFRDRASVKSMTNA